MSTQPMPPADLDAERRFGRIAGGLALLSVLLTLAATPISAINAPKDPGDNDDLRLLTNVGLNESGQVGGIAVHAIGLLLMLPLVVFLFRAIRARNDEHLWFIPVLGVVATILLAVSLPLGFLEVRDAAREFVDSGPRTAARAKELVDGTSTVPADVAKIVGLLALGIWISLTSAEAQRVGLLTRFLGMFGLGAGITTAIGLPIGAAGLFIGWLGSVALLAVGYWPGGRPPAWDEGRALTWDEVDARDAGHPGRAAR